MRLAAGPHGIVQRPVERARRRSLQGVSGRGRSPVKQRDRLARRLHRVRAALLIPANRTRLMIRVRQPCREKILPLTPGLQRFGTSKARCGVMWLRRAF